ncbi:MAG: hypothetical protein SCARUB_02473 [Candidatus Scalindua rubra]|uniref:Sulfatase N-terminal domain-containing protein n=1 Tax=Candidatus Scalindua rubra TaxID=1872076 RepID=A0A1E3X9U0_9BACT|nr:MAG: hypothetical protein SCARUB_02473 [Candidatus Scalindua rubra]
MSFLKTCFCRFIFIILFSGITYFNISCSQKPYHTTSVILITFDSLRADSLSCYGYKRRTSYHIDQIASESFLFQNTFSQTYFSGPSISSILTSLYPISHGVIRNSISLDDKHVTLQEILKSYGYDTAAIVNVSLLGHDFNYQQGFKIFNYVKGYPVKDEDSGEWYNSVFKNAAQLLKLQENNKFFLWIHCNYTHASYKPPEKYRDLFAKDVNIDKKYLHYRELIEAWNAEMLNKEDVDYARSQYDAEIVHADELFGQFIEELKEYDLLENIILVVTADHGEAFNFLKGRFGMVNTFMMRSFVCHY